MCDQYPRAHRDPRRSAICLLVLLCMNIIVDLDWTLFDVAAVRRALEDAEATEQWLQPEVWDTLNAADFFYSDALPWLSEQRAAGASLHLLTLPKSRAATAVVYQERKVLSSGISEYVDSYEVIGECKAEHIGRWLIADDINVMIDDRPSELQAVGARYPEVALVRIRRPDTKYADEPTPEDVLEISTLANFDPSTVAQ